MIFFSATKHLFYHALSSEPFCGQAIVYDPVTRMPTFLAMLTEVIPLYSHISPGMPNYHLLLGVEHADQALMWSLLHLMEKKLLKKHCSCCSKCGLESQGSKNFKVCAGCSVAYYCGKNCQVGDWAKHKPVCKAIQREVKKRDEDEEARMKDPDVVLPFSYRLGKVLKGEGASLEKLLQLREAKRNRAKA